MISTKFLTTVFTTISIYLSICLSIFICSQDIHYNALQLGLCESSFLLLEYSIEYLIEYSMDNGSSY